MYGKFTDKIMGEDLTTGEVFTIFEAPDYPENKHLMYNMNFFTLQLNLLSDQLKEKLPPTDSRLRGDIRAWESCNLAEASREKDRLERNQRDRRKQLKAILPKGTDMNNEHTFYEPKFFKKVPMEGKLKFEYEPKNLYWKMREEQDWSSLPKIFEDGTKPFY